MRATVVLLLAAAVARAQSPTPGEAATRVVAAHDANDTAAVRALAAQDLPDPWLVADDLCARGAYAAAAAFAAAARRPDVERLPEFVAREAKSPTAPEARATRTRARDLFDRQDSAGALALLEGLCAEGVTGVRVDLLRARALHGLQRWQESAQAFGRAAQAAEDLGWLAVATAAAWQAASSRFAAGDYRGGLLLLERALALQPKRGTEVEVPGLLGDMGLYHQRLGNVDEAVRLHEEALVGARRLKQAGVEANALLNLAAIEQDRGDYPGALARNLRCLDLAANGTTTAPSPAPWGTWA